MVFLACAHAKVRTTATVLVRETIVFALLAPFLLPHVHERYWRNRPELPGAQGEFHDHGC